MYALTFCQYDFPLPSGAINAALMSWFSGLYWYWWLVRSVWGEMTCTMIGFSRPLTFCCITYTRSFPIRSEIWYSRCWLSHVCSSFKQAFFSSALSWCWFSFKTSMSENVIRSLYKDVYKGHELDCHRISLEVSKKWNIALSWSLHAESMNWVF